MGYTAPPRRLADAAPPAIADAGAIGTIEEAAREDHTHALHAQTARLDTAQTFTAEQSIASGTSFFPGGSPSVFGNTVSLHIMNNARWNGTNYVRRQARNAASRLFQDGNTGDLVYFTTAAADTGNTVDSIITFTERFRVTTAGLVSSSAGYVRGVTSITVATTLTSSNDVVIAGGTTAYTVTLPAVSTGLALDIKRTSTGVITVSRAGTALIDGATTFVLNAQYDSVSLVSDGTNWHVI